ncbi:AbrB/MazE/SpoVT family DNA-binding domain-containing protein [Facklamia sp. P12950]|uniref:AbrB/MazE/SpoVT family DNA-binding domain-containing protein n=1 Tax=Facklamia sp. P12950 TaxID=3421951 RepID=UPI003D183C54
MEKEELIYLDTYVLQRDMRIRLPKSIIENLQATKGKTKFKIYCDAKNSQLILRKDADRDIE